MSVRNYSFGVFSRNDAAQTADLDRQIWLAHKYYNEHIALIRKRMEDDKAAMRAIEPALIPIDTELEAAERELAEAIKAGKKYKSANKVKSLPKGVAAPIREARTVCKAVRHRMYELEKPTRATEAYKTAEANHMDAFVKAGKDLYSLESFADLFWCSKNAVKARTESAVKKKREAAIKRWAKGRPASLEPDFRQWSRSGQLGLQIQRVISFAEAFEGNTWFQLARIPDKNPEICRIKVRIGSNGRDPVFAEFEGHLPWAALAAHHGISHWRAMPFEDFIRTLGDAGVRVPMVYIQRYATHLHHDKWGLSLVVRVGTDQRAVHNRKFIAFNFGWRKMGDNLRVAYWGDSDGNEGSVEIPPNIWSATVYTEPELVSRISHSFNQIVELLSEWMKENTLPQWHRENLESLASWKSWERLARVISNPYNRPECWRDRRFEGDESIFPELLKWCQQANIWAQQADRIRRQAFNRRRELFRLFVKSIKERYGLVLLDSTDISALREEEEIEDEVGEVIPKKMRNAASPGLLKSMLSSLRYYELPSVGVTMCCHNCDKVCKFDRSNLHHTCEHCAFEWDQDQNAVRNMLRLYRRIVEGSGDSPPGVTPGQEQAIRGRFQRQKAKKLAKQQEAAGAAPTEPQTS